LDFFQKPRFFQNPTDSKINAVFAVQYSLKHIFLERTDIFKKPVISIFFQNDGQFQKPTLSKIKAGFWNKNFLKA